MSLIAGRVLTPDAAKKMLRFRVDISDVEEVFAKPWKTVAHDGAKKTVWGKDIGIVVDDAAREITNILLKGTTSTQENVNRSLTNHSAPHLSGTHYTRPAAPQVNRNGPVTVQHVLFKRDGTINRGFKDMTMAEYLAAQAAFWEAKRA